MKDYVLDMYRQMFANVKRGNNKGVYSNAKPVFLLSLMDFVIFSKENKFMWGDERFEEIYLTNFSKMGASRPTPFWKPFFYMASEPFYSLIWDRTPDKKSLSHPSGKILKDFLSYAKLDDELWELLQVDDNRAYLKDNIIKTYFTE